MPEFDYKEELDNGGFRRVDVPKNIVSEFYVTIGAITEKPANQGGTKYGIPFDIVEGEYQDGRIWENIFWKTEDNKLNGISKSKLARICQAAKAPEHMVDWTIDLEGRGLIIKVKPSKNNSEFRDITCMQAGPQEQQPASQPAQAELPKTEDKVSDDIPF